MGLVGFVAGQVSDAVEHGSEIALSIGSAGGSVGKEVRLLIVVHDEDRFNKNKQSSQSSISFVS